MAIIIKNIIIDVLVNVICDKAVDVLQTVAFLDVSENVDVSFNI